MAGELISREALERIIQRAAELQAAERDIGEGLTKDELLTLGQDVGIPTRYLQQALLEEQTRTVVEEGHGTLPWLAGPLRLSAPRGVRGERAALLKALGGWMEDEELLQVKRRYADRTSWEPKVGAFASIQRALGSKGKTYALARAAEVAGQVTQLEPGFCHAQLMANVQNLRKARLAGAGALAALATAAVALGAAVPIPLISPLPFVTGAALGVTAPFGGRGPRPPNEGGQIGREQRLHHRDRRPEGVRHRHRGRDRRPRAQECAVARARQAVRLRHDLRIQHIEPHDRRHGRGHAARRPLRGAALLQPGAADAARGGRADRDHVGGDVPARARLHQHARQAAR